MASFAGLFIRKASFFLYAKMYNIINNEEIAEAIRKEAKKKEVKKK
ncbi:MAG: hypothetical protein IJC39_02465 [Firmicutes bacterium]|nr:hypothetical protein [Bacillota bacterium]